MKVLKRGDFVWSKGYGMGLVCDHDITSDWAYGVLFENTPNPIYCIRKDLFAKGDEVMAVGWTGYEKIPEGVFIGITNSASDNQLIIKNSSGYLTFVNRIKHKPIDKLEVILTMNGKEIDVKAISKETWDNLRSLK